MNRARLALLAAHMETVPVNRFNMRTWLNSNLDLDDTPADKLYQKPDECGTTACAAGWACAIPEFKKDGLKMKKSWGFHYPSYNDSDEDESFKAMAEFFDISVDESEHLFDPTEYSNFQLGDPKYVIQRIYGLLTA